MEEFTQKWGVISLLENASEGSEFYFTDFPLHVTLAGVFAVDKSGQQLFVELNNFLARRTTLEIEADQKAMFGPNQDVAVMKIKKTADLMALYLAVHLWLEDTKATYTTPQYEGEGYLPHSTFQNTGSLKPGEKRLLKSISLVDLFPNNNGYQRKIFGTIDLQ